MKENYLARSVFSEISRKLKPQKVLILLGPRRVGKTAILKEYVASLDKKKYLFYNGEDIRTHELLAERSIRNYRRVIGNHKLLVIDEAQKIPDIGNKLKLMVDTVQDLRILVTGSSMLDLTNRLGEPLLGRSYTLRLFPLAQMEYSKYEKYADTRDKLEERLIFGSYPELEQINDWDEKAEYLDELIGSNLLKDILEFEGIRKSGKILDLLRLIAFQTGKEISVDELANNLKGISRNTVEHYLELLSQVFVIYKVGGFSRNLRKEIIKSNRWYFVDNGVRNAVLKNFNQLRYRPDAGELWENYVMSERIKYNAYTRKSVHYYFWRTYDQQEIDLIEEANGKLSAWEFKWNSGKKNSKAPAGWTRTYPEAKFKVITPDNYLDFIQPTK